MLLLKSYHFFRGQQQMFCRVKERRGGAQVISRPPINLTNLSKHDAFIFNNEKCENVIKPKNCTYPSNSSGNTWKHITK